MPPKGSTSRLPPPPTTTTSRGQFSTSGPPPSRVGKIKSCASMSSTTAKRRVSHDSGEGQQAPAKKQKVRSGKNQGKEVKTNGVKKPGKKRRVDDVEKVERSAEAATCGGPGAKPPTTQHSLVELVTKRIPRKTIDRNWRKLSSGAQTAMRGMVEDAAAVLLVGLKPSATQAFAEVLQEVYLEFDDYLSSVLVPPLETSVRGLVGTSSSVAQQGEYELPTRESVEDKTTLFESALGPEANEIVELERLIKREQKALEDDEARLLSFESARDRVERAEKKEAARAMDPLLRSLFDSQSAPLDSSGGLLDKQSIVSEMWVQEGVKLDRLPRTKPRADEEGGGDGFDPAEDDYLIALSLRLGKSLTEIETRLEGIDRVEQVVDDLERVIVHSL